VSFLLAFFGASPARLQGLLLGAAAAAVLCMGLAGWALLERSGRFQCREALQGARDQAAVLAAAVKAQSASIDQLGAESRAARADTAQRLAELDRRDAGARATLEALGRQLAAATPAAAGGKPRGCDDYLKAWRAEP
jgi:type II secretory pathway component PulK